MAPSGGHSCFGTLVSMYFCYLDEAGCTGSLPSAGSPIQPVFAVTGLILHRSRLADITRRFVALKARFFPGLMQSARHQLDRILVEVKGADLRADVHGLLPTQARYRSSGTTASC